MWLHSLFLVKSLGDSFGAGLVINLVKNPIYVFQPVCLGRKLACLGTAFITALFGGVSALSPTFEWLIALRFLLGLGLGGTLSVEIVYFMEFLPSKSRGFRTTFIILFGIFGGK